MASQYKMSHTAGEIDDCIDLTNKLLKGFIEWEDIDSINESGSYPISANNEKNPLNENGNLCVFRNSTIITNVIFYPSGRILYRNRTHTDDHHEEWSAFREIATQEVI